MKQWTTVFKAIGCRNGKPNPASKCLERSGPKLCWMHSWTAGQAWLEPRIPLDPTMSEGYRFGGAVARRPLCCRNRTCAAWDCWEGAQRNVADSFSVISRCSRSVSTAQWASRNCSSKSTTFISAQGPCTQGGLLQQKDAMYPFAGETRLGSSMTAMSHRSAIPWTTRHHDKLMPHSASQQSAKGDDRIQVRLLRMTLWIPYSPQPHARGCWQSGTRYAYFVDAVHTLQPHQILRLPRKMNLMMDLHHIWNVIYNARSNSQHPPTSPNTAPATQNESHDGSASHMKRHLQCAEQQSTPSNLTKYCACHAKWISWWICITYETSFTMRGATVNTLQPHQILRLPRKMNLMMDPQHIWNVIYNARSNSPHPPTSPNIAPATQNESHDGSASHMKRHLQCAEQQSTPSNLTKYCACHAKWISWLIRITYETSFTMRGATVHTLQPHQILRLPRKMNLMMDLHHIWNVIYNARSNSQHPPTSPNTAPATQNESHDGSTAHMKRYLQCAEQQSTPSNLTKYCTCHAKWISWLIRITYETSFTMRGATVHTLRPHQILRLPRKMTIQHLTEMAWEQLNLKRHLQCATDPSMIREWSEHDPRMIRPRERKPQPAAPQRLLLTLARSRFYWKLQRFPLRLSFQNSPNAAPATKSNTWTSPNAAPCHENWHLNFTKCCACQEKWHMNFTKCCACQEKCYYYYCYYYYCYHCYCYY